MASDVKAKNCAHCNTEPETREQTMPKYVDRLRFKVSKETFKTGKVMVRCPSRCYSFWVDLETWNSRPVEDAMSATLERIYNRTRSYDGLLQYDGLAWQPIQQDIDELRDKGLI